MSAKRIIKTHGNDPIAAGRLVITKDFDDGSSITGPYDHSGITKREYFAAMVLSGMSSLGTGIDHYKAFAKIAVEQTDALIEELNKGT